MFSKLAEEPPEFAGGVVVDPARELALDVELNQGY